jgi:hypothetical protein
MTYHEACEKLLEGKIVRRPDHYALIFEGEFLYNENGSDVLITREDMKATDWEIYNAKRETND